MPLFYFRCTACDEQARKIMTPAEARVAQRCGACGGALTRDPRPPSSQAVETLDNGVMTQRLERLADAERLFAERNDSIKKQQTNQ